MRPYLVYVSARDGHCLAGLYGPTRNFDVAINNWSAAGNAWNTCGVDCAFGENLEKFEGAAPCWAVECCATKPLRCWMTTLKSRFPRSTTCLPPAAPWGCRSGRRHSTRDSTWSYRVTRQQDNSLARCSEIVEIMMPVFSRAALERFLPTFAETQSGWGLDFLWAELLHYRGMAVFDCFPARHARPITSDHRIPGCTRRDGAAGGAGLAPPPLNWRLKPTLRQKRQRRKRPRNPSVDPLHK